MKRVASASSPTRADTAPTQTGAAQGRYGTIDGAEVSARERYLAELRALIESRKFYPKASQRLGETGVVMVRFEVFRDGRVDAVSVQAGSPYDRLNEAARVLVAGLSRVKPLPGEIGAEKISMQLPIQYSLN